MTLFYTSHKDLSDYRSEGEFNKIAEFKKELLENLPDELKNDLDENDLVLDYSTLEIKLPNGSIPFKFILKPKEIKINQYLEKFVIVVNWKDQK